MAKPDPRQQVAEALAAKLTPEQLEMLVDNVLAISKRARGWCPKCKGQVWVDIPDAKAVTGSLNDLMIQAWGRPGQAEVEQDRTFSFVNKVVLVADDQ